MNQDTLNKAQSIATIFSLIAVPIFVAVIGYQIQKNISQEGVRKDYVQMAIGILSKKDAPEDKELREWAVTVLEKNSPVPFSKKVKFDLYAGAFFLRPKLLPEIINSPFMEAPKKISPLPSPEGITIDKLLDSYSENYSAAIENSIKLEALQKMIRITAKTEEKLADPNTYRYPETEKQN